MRKLLRLVRLRIEVNIFLEQKSNRKSKAESKTEVTVLHCSMGKKYRVTGDPEYSPLLEIRGKDKSVQNDLK